MSDQRSFLGRFLGGKRKTTDETAEHQDVLYSASENSEQDIAKPEAVLQEVPHDDHRAEEPISWFKRLTSGLKRTRDSFLKGLGGLFTRARIDEDTLQSFEDLLLRTDLGLPATEVLIQDVETFARDNGVVSAEDVRRILETRLIEILTPVAKPLIESGATALAHPCVILVVGVNGTGKTTTIGKLADVFRQQNLKVVLSASDTFRAAACEQLGVWAARTGAHLVHRETGADPAGVAYDALSQAIETDADVVIVDTAGRLQNKAELMEELKKIRRVLEKRLPGAPHHVLLTLDATTGQNAINQVEVFRNVAGVTGLVMTKLDGTARGGILIAVAEKFGLPIHYIGVGESLDDLEPFHPEEFVRAFLEG